MPYLDLEMKQKYHSAYYQKNKELIKARAKQYFQDNKEKQTMKTKAWLAEHFEWQLWQRAKQSAKPRKLDFDIKPEDITIPTHCPYLGIPLTTISDGGRQETNASLDRIDNTKGYIKGNIQVISSKANFMKRNASIEELVCFAQGVLKLHI